MQLFVSTLNFVIFNFEGLKLFLKIFNYNYHLKNEPV